MLLTCPSTHAEGAQGHGGGKLLGRSGLEEGLSEKEGLKQRLEGLVALLGEKGH